MLKHYELADNLVGELSDDGLMMKSRPLGSKDKQPRKPRSDKGSHRSTYGGRPTRSGQAQQPGAQPSGGGSVRTGTPPVGAPGGVGVGPPGGVGGGFEGRFGGGGQNYFLQSGGGGRAYWNQGGVHLGRPGQPAMSGDPNTGAAYGSYQNPAQGGGGYTGGGPGTSMGSFPVGAPGQPGQPPGEDQGGGWQPDPSLPGGGSPPGGWMPGEIGGAGPVRGGGYGGYFLQGGGGGGMGAPTGGGRGGVISFGGGAVPPAGRGQMDYFLNRRGGGRPGRGRMVTASDDGDGTVTKGLAKNQPGKPHKRGPANFRDKRSRVGYSKRTQRQIGNNIARHPTAGINPSMMSRDTTAPDYLGGRTDPAKNWRAHEAAGYKPSNKNRPMRKVLTTKDSAIGMNTSDQPALTRPAKMGRAKG